MSDLPAAKVVASDHQPQHTTMLGPLAIVLAVLGTASFVLGILRTRIFAKLQSPDVEYFSELTDSLEAMMQLGGPLFLACGIAIAVIVFKMYRRMPPGRLASVALAALVAVSLNGLVELVVRVAEFARLHWVLNAMWGNTGIVVVLLLINSGSAALLLWLLHERTPPDRRSPLLWLGAGALGIHTAYVFYGVFSEPSEDRNLWLRFLLSSGTWAVASIVTAWLAWRERNTQETAPPTLGLAWASASSGLRLYERALVWRLLLTVGGYLLLFMAAKGGWLGMVETLSWSLPLAGLVTATLMTIGVFVFANQPRHTRGGGAATLAGSLMSVALLIDLALVASILRLLQSDSDDFYGGGLGDARDALEAAQSMAHWGMLASLGAFVALLVSFSRVAKALGAEDLAEKAFNVGLMVVIMGGFAVSLRFWLSSAKRISQETAILAAVGVLIAVLVLVIAHLGLVGRLRSRIEHATMAEPSDQET